MTTFTPDGHTAAAIIPAGGGVPRVLQAGPFNEGAPAFSPDGQWLAMESDESGRTEIVVRAVADGRRFVVSADGGSTPRWSADGRCLYYTSGRRMIRAAVDTTANAVTARDTLFDRPGAQILAVTPAGRVLAARGPAAADRGLIVLQWLRELRQQLPLPVTAPR